MKDEENLKIFLKAIKKANKKGFNSSKHFPETQLIGEEEEELIYIRHEIMVGIIFSRDFAEAFWGKEYPKEMNLRGNFPYYELELTQLAMAKDRFKYLEQFLNKK